MLPLLWYVRYFIQCFILLLLRKCQLFFLSLSIPLSFHLFSLFSFTLSFGSGRRVFKTILHWSRSMPELKGTHTIFFRVLNSFQDWMTFFSCYRENIFFSLLFLRLYLMPVHLYSHVALSSEKCTTFRDSHGICLFIIFIPRARERERERENVISNLMVAKFFALGVIILFNFDVSAKLDFPVVFGKKKSDWT